MINNVISLIKDDEGFKPFAYDDATGEEVKAPVGKLTFAIGWNIQDNNITEEFAEMILNYFVKNITNDLCVKIDFFTPLDLVRQAVLINICFNVGLNGLLKFKNTLALIRYKKYEQAGIELLDSDAARKLPKRYSRLSKMLITGEWPQ